MPMSLHPSLAAAQDLRAELEVPLQVGVSTLLLWGAVSSTQHELDSASLQAYVNSTLSPVVQDICGKYGCGTDPLR